MLKQLVGAKFIRENGEVRRRRLSRLTELNAAGQKRYGCKKERPISGPHMANVEVNRANEGAAPAPQETCLRRASVPTIGSASIWYSF